MREFLGYRLVVEARRGLGGRCEYLTTILSSEIMGKLENLRG
jgi:hypothetical protein